MVLLLKREGGDIYRLGGSKILEKETVTLTPESIEKQAEETFEWETNGEEEFEDESRTPEEKSFLDDEISDKAEEETEEDFEDFDYDDFSF